MRDRPPWIVIRTGDCVLRGTWLIVAQSAKRGFVRAVCTLRGIEINGCPKRATYIAANACVPNDNIWRMAWPLQAGASGGCGYPGIPDQPRRGRPFYRIAWGESPAIIPLMASQLNTIEANRRQAGASWLEMPGSAPRRTSTRRVAARVAKLGCLFRINCFREIGSFPCQAPFRRRCRGGHRMALIGRPDTTRAPAAGLGRP